MPMCYVEGTREVIDMDDRLRNWHPTDEELEQILREMRPIIREFARRAVRNPVPAAAGR